MFKNNGLDAFVFAIKVFAMIVVELDIFVMATF